MLCDSPNLQVDHFKKHGIQETYKLIPKALCVLLEPGRAVGVIVRVGDVVILSGATVLAIIGAVVDISEVSPLVVCEHAETSRL